MIEIRSFEPVHAQGVVEVILPIQRSEFGIPITLEAQPDLQNIPSFYQHGAGNFWVALAGSTVVGTIALLDIGNRQIALRKMFVASAFRGRSHDVAKRLLETSLAWCRDHGVMEVFLGTIAAFRAAHRFYEKNGFAEVPQAGLPAGFPVMSVDTKFYRRALSL